MLQPLPLPHGLFTGATSVDQLSVAISVSGCKLIASAFVSNHGSFLASSKGLMQCIICAASVLVEK